MRMRGCIAGLAGTLLLVACGGDPAGQDTLNVEPALDSAALARQKRTKAIFYNIPSPMETAALLRKAGADYNQDILNDVLNVDKYTAASKQALNLGIYGADLSYASVFNNTQESMFYTSCAKKLADKLGVSHAFSDSTLDRMEANRNQRDSLLDIISETFWEVDAYLKENDRENISALMVTGGWMEGLYIATQVCLTNDTPELRQRIAEQKLPLTDLLALVSSYSSADESVAAVLADLKALEPLFAEVIVSGGSNSMIKEGEMTVIGGSAASASLTDAQLKAIVDKAAAIRNTYIN